METSLYHYHAIIKEVYDGDTCRADIDLGMGTWIHGESLRLYRINAPEVKGSTRAAGLRSRDFLREKVLDKTIIIQTIKDRKEKYGRFLAEIWIQGQGDAWININDLLVKEGFAIYQDYE